MGWSKPVPGILSNEFCNTKISPISLLPFSRHGGAFVKRGPPVVFLANEFLERLAGSPVDIPTDSPRLCVRPGIVERGFIPQCVVIDAGESFGHVMVIGSHQTPHV